MDSFLYRHSKSGEPPLRIGLLLDTALLSKCFAEVVDHIIQSDFARLELLVFNAEALRDATRPRPARSRTGKLIDTLLDSKRRRKLLFTLYERWDRRHIDSCDDPLDLVDCSGRFGQVESLLVTPAAKGFVHRFPADAIERIRGKRLDVLIRFGFNILRGEILTSARFGIWSYHHGDNEYYRGGPAYFWEVREGNPISGAILQVLTDELDAGKVLCKGLFGTFESISQARNRVQPYWGASTFMIQKLRELHEHGWEHVERNAVRPALYLGKKRIYTTPTNVEMVHWLAPVLIRKILRRSLRRPVIRHWRLASRVGAPPLMNSGSAPSLDGFRWIESPKGRFYADPFVIEAAGKPWVFFEDFDYATERGKISCAEVRDGGLAMPVTALERPYHLSYPCVFRDGDSWYMIPESKNAGTVDLYRCVRFPDVWELERELYKGCAVDTTIWIEGGLYWFFVTLVEPRGTASQLRGFFTLTRLAGIGHRIRPILFPQTSAIPAGRARSSGTRAGCSDRVRTVA